MSVDVDGAPEWLIRANEDGTLPPLVFFHTWPGEANHLRRLAPHLGPDQPLFGIEPPDDATAAALRRVPDWVDFFLTRLPAVPVGSPFWLAGFSFGGVVALEVSRRLEAAGGEVPYLGLIDTTRPKQNPPGFVSFLRYHLRELVEVDPSARRSYAATAVRRLGRNYSMRIKRRLYQAVALVRGTGPPRTLGDAKRLPELTRAVQRAFLNYEPPQVHRPVALFHTPQSTERAGGDPMLRWARYLRGGVDLYPLRGEHFEFFDEPNVAHTARQLGLSLEVAALRQDRSIDGLSG